MDNNTPNNYSNDMNNNLNNDYVNNQPVQPVEPVQQPVQPIEPVASAVEPVQQPVQNFEPQPVVSEQPIEIPQQVQPQVFNSNITDLTANQNIQPNNNPVKQSGNNKIVFIIVGIVVAIIIIIGLIIGIMSLTKNKSEKEKSIDEMLTSSDVFFIKNNDGIYAMFNIEGKQISGFDYKYAYDFINGASLVEDKEGKKNVVNTDNKIVFSGENCTYLSRKGSFYECTSKEYTKKIIDSNGNTIDEGRYIDAYDYNDNKFIIIQDKNAKKYTVYDYKGNAINSFDLSNESSQLPKACTKDNYLTVFYNNSNYIYDLSKSKIILTLEGQYALCVSDINKNNSDEFILTPSGEWYDKIESYSFKYVKNGNVVYSKDTPSGNLYFQGSNLNFYDKGENKSYILDSAGNNALEVNDTIQFINYNTYATYKLGSNGIVRTRSNGEETTVKPSVRINNEYVNIDGISLYVDGKEKTTVPCTGIQLSRIDSTLADKNFAVNDIYLFSGCNINSEYAYYKKDGTKLFDNYFKTATPFDSNGIAFVSTEKDKVYMMDIKGNKLSGEYTRFTKNDFYIGTKEDKTKDLIDKNGNVLASGKSIDIDLNLSVYSDYAIIENDGKYDVFDTKKKKTVVTLSSKPTKYNQYFTTRENSKTQYYSYINGNIFYEE